MTTSKAIAVLGLLALSLSVASGTQDPWVKKMYETMQVDIQAVGAYSPQPYSPSPGPYSPQPYSPAFRAGSPRPASSPGRMFDPAPSPIPQPASWPFSPALAPSGAQGSQYGASPSPATVQTESMCTGLSYDGSLSSCLLWFEQASDTQTLILEGAIEMPAQYNTDKLGVAFIVPTNIQGFGKVAAGQSTFCHDMATGITVVLPLAAPKPASCSSKLSVTPVSSMLVYGSAVGLTEEELKIALGLADSAVVGEYNALKAAQRGGEGANDYLVADININTIVTVYSILYAKKPEAFPRVAQLYFEALASAAKRSANTSAGRLHMLSAGTLDLTSGRALQQLVAQFLVSGRQQTEAGDLYTPKPAVVAMVTNAVSALTSMAASAPSALEVQQTVADAMLRIATQVQALVRGDMSLEHFMGSISAASLIPTPASPATPTPTAATAAGAAAGGHGSNAGVIAGGVIGGVIGTAILVGVAVYIVRRQRRRSGCYSVLWTNAAANQAPLMS